jgi:hypothetical protein
VHQYRSARSNFIFFSTKAGDNDKIGLYHIESRNVVQANLSLRLISENGASQFLKPRGFNPAKIAGRGPAGFG